MIRAGRETQLETVREAAGAYARRPMQHAGILARIRTFFGLD